MRRLWIAVAVVTVLALVAAGVTGYAYVSATRAADEAGAAYSRDVDAYVARLVKAEKSINGLTPALADPPALAPARSGDRSAAYRDARARQAVLQVHLDEVFERIPDFDPEATYPTAAIKADGELTQDYNLGLSSDYFDYIAESDDVALFRKDLLKNTREDLAAVETYRGAIARLDVGSYGQQSQRFLLAQVDRWRASIERTIADLEDATTLAAVRGARYRNRIATKMPENRPGYGLFALDTLWRQSWRLSDPAVSSLEESMERARGKTVEEARLLAYVHLYGYTAVYNTPTTKDDEVTTKRKLGVVAYALDALGERLRDTSLGRDREARLARLAAAQQAFAELPFGIEPTDEPSATSRIKVAFELVSGTSDYDGYSDVLRSIEELLRFSGPLEGGAFDDEAFAATTRFARDRYPTGYLAAEVEDYDEAAQACIEIRTSFHQDVRAELERQQELGEGISDLASATFALRDRAGDRPTPSQRRRLAANEREFQATRAEIRRLDRTVTRAETQQTKDLKACQPALSEALGAAYDRGADRKAHLEYVLGQARRIYR